MTYYHSIKITGNLTIESRQKNFRRALSEYLSKPEAEGIQLKIKDIDDPRRPSEDIVVTMVLVSMKQNPHDHCFKKPQQPRQDLVLTTDASAASDKAFY